jgi:uncharacterized C2H2 Zn-finger protein
MSSDPKLPLGSCFCRCPECGEYFASETSFDLHRTGSHQKRERACFAPIEVRDKHSRPMLRLNEKGYWVLTIRPKIEEAA